MLKQLQVRRTLSHTLHSTHNTDRAQQIIINGIHKQRWEWEKCGSWQEREIEPCIWASARNAGNKKERSGKGSKQIPHDSMSAQSEIFRGNQEMTSSNWKDISDLVIITRIPVPVKNSTAVATWHSFSKPLPRKKYRFDSWCINSFPFMLMVWIWTKQSDGWHLNEVPRIPVDGFEMDQANLMVDIKWSSKDSSWWFWNGPSESDGWHRMKFQGFQLMVSKWTKRIWWLTLNEVPRIPVDGFEMDQANLMVDIEWSSKDSSWWFQNGSIKRIWWLMFERSSKDSSRWFRYRQSNYWSWMVDIWIKLETIWVDCFDID